MKVREIEINPANIEDFNGHRFDGICANRLESIFASIEASGFDSWCPVILAEENGRFFIVNGRHRTLASRALGVDKIPATVVDWSDFEEVFSELGDLEQVAIAIEYAAS